MHSTVQYCRYLKINIINNMYYLSGHPHAHQGHHGDSCNSYLSHDLRIFFVLLKKCFDQH
jgi:hypothetical protein